ncbi:GrpB family protein [Marinimicrobium sp. ABcell2]|uniref:GrpB family protein n=1 Tax=Marinimicrobium sp. ABcell2 TaxID=3069751 RepID=UPI0027AE2BBC|nr:GrpB family protein [Marinimicrobium sp. ABcell2]MDQ2076261.1 GrpB family protein [Marinimicrobium sp. ABcell2]
MSQLNDETVSFSPEKYFRLRIEKRFEELRNELQAMVPNSEIEHVGSTAIPGSLTKGDLDIQVRIGKSEYSAAKDKLFQLYDVNHGGFTAEDAISFEDYSSDPHVGIHLTVRGGSGDIQYLFRDRLIASEPLRREYDNLKRRYEGKSMAEYRDAKEKFVMRVLDGTASPIPDAMTKKE